MRSKPCLMCYENLKPIEFTQLEKKKKKFNKPNYNIQTNQQLFSHAGSFGLTLYLNKNLVSDLVK